MQAGQTRKTDVTCESGHGLLRVMQTCAFVKNVPKPYMKPANMQMISNNAEKHVELNCRWNMLEQQNDAWQCMHGKHCMKGIHWREGGQCNQVGRHGMQSIHGKHCTRANIERTVERQTGWQSWMQSMHGKHCNEGQALEGRRTMQAGWLEWHAKHAWQA